MIWAQAGVSFLLWIIYGVVQARRSRKIRESMRRIKRGTRKAMGPLILFGSGAIMLAGLFGVYTAGGFQPEGMAWWGWIALTLLGLIFVHGQTMATAMLLSVVEEQVTEDVGTASVQRESGEPNTP